MVEVAKAEGRVAVGRAAETVGEVTEEGRVEAVKEAAKVVEGTEVVRVVVVTEVEKMEVETAGAKGGEARAVG